MNVEFMNKVMEPNTVISSCESINSFMESKGFKQQGNIYFGTYQATAVTCILTIQGLATEYDWASSCVKDIRLIRIEENTDLQSYFSQWCQGAIKNERPATVNPTF